MERFRTCFYRPMLSSSANFERWMRSWRQGHRRPGRRDLAQEAGGVRAAAAGRRHPRRARRLRDPPPPRTRRLASQAARRPGSVRWALRVAAPECRRLAMGLRRHRQIVVWSSSPGRARSAGVYPGAPRRADPLVLPHRWPARGHRPAPGGRRRPAALAAAAGRRGAHRGGPDPAQRPVQRGDAPRHAAPGGRRVHADLAGGGPRPPPRAGARARRVLHPGPALRPRSDLGPVPGQRHRRAARDPRPSGHGRPVSR